MPLTRNADHNLSPAQRSNNGSAARGDQAAPSRVAILHHTGGGNLGDDASVDAVIRNIRLRWPDAALAAFTMNPEDTAAKYGIPCYPIRRHTWSLGYGKEKTADRSLHPAPLRWLTTTRTPAIRLPRALLLELDFWKNCRRILRSFDLLVLSGGGQFTDRGGTWAFPYAILTWFLLARSAGVRCIVLNVGAGPIFHRMSRMAVVGALRMADYVSFRDPESQDLACRLGFKGQSSVSPDSVYGLPIPRFQGSPMQGGRPVVGLAPMLYPCDPPFHATEDRAIYQALVDKLARFASSLIGHSYEVALFGTDVGADPQAIEDLRARLRDAHGIVLPTYDPASSVGELLTRMAGMDCVVTCRFHAIVFAHLLNKPVLALSPHPKVTSLMEMVGLSKYCVGIRDCDAARLEEMFASLLKDRAVIKERMARSRALFQSQLAWQFDTLFPVRAASETVAAGQP